MADESLMTQDQQSTGNVETPVTPPDEGQAVKEGSPTPTPPIEYTDFSIPEGVEIDKGMLEKFKSTVQKVNLPQEVAQEIIDLSIERERQRAAAQEEAWSEILTDWRNKAESHKEYGGAKLQDNLKAIQETIQKLLPDPEEQKQLFQDLDMTGMGNHPVLVHLLHKVAQVVREDSFIPPPGSPGGDSSRSIARTLFPEMA